MYRVLIVEDEPAIAETMKKQIECWGNEAACVTDFQNVAAEFASYDPHLVLMDIMLPFYNGYLCATALPNSSSPMYASANITTISPPLLRVSIPLWASTTLAAS